MEIEIKEEYLKDCKHHNLIELDTSMERYRKIVPSYGSFLLIENYDLDRHGKLKDYITKYFCKDCETRFKRLKSNGELVPINK